MTVSRANAVHSQHLVSALFIVMYSSLHHSFEIFLLSLLYITESSVVRSVRASIENGTLHLTWQPPASPEGTILNYTVQIIPLNEEETRSEVTTTTMFSATNLSKFNYVLCFIIMKAT